MSINISSFAPSLKDALKRAAYEELKSTLTLDKIEVSAPKKSDDIGELLVEYIFSEGKRSVKSLPGYSSFKEKMESILKSKFRKNLRKADPVSTFTLLRRKAFENLGEAGAGAISSDDRSPYNKALMNRAIDSFNVSVSENKSNNSISFRMNLDDSKVPKDDFQGLRSGFRAPSDVVISMVGLNVKSHKGYTSDDRMMMIPTNKRNYANAILKSDGEVSYNMEDSGLPILFRKEVSSVNRHHYNPSTKERLVFWGFYNGKTILPNNVKKAIFDFI